MALYVRNLLAKGKYDYLKTSEAHDELMATREAFESLIYELWDRYKESGEDVKD